MGNESGHTYPSDLLVTKLFIPKARSDLVVRPRLIERLDSSEGKKLILVTAPAGYGKTTLLTEWFSQGAENVAWFSLDKADNDIGRFLSYCVLALQQVSTEICDSVLNIIRSPDPPPIDTLLTFIINDLACMRSFTRLVLDDFHLISNPQVHYALSYLLQNLPPNLQIVVTSRAELPFSISDLRAKDQALVIDTYGLRFNHEETAEFVRKFFKVDLTPAQLLVLDQQTEGWVTGLQLAAIGTRNDPEVGDILQHLSGDDRLIRDYLFDEVFSHQPAEVQEFMLITSGFRRFSAPLCDAVLERQNSSEIIEYLNQANLFVIPLDNKWTWYRYHHLLSDLLQNQRQHLVKEQTGLFLRAARWFEENDFIEEAIEYALEGKHFEFAARMIEPKVSIMISSGGREQIIRWLKVIPKQILRSVGQLWQHYVIAWLDKGDFNEAERILKWVWDDLERVTDLSAREKAIINGYLDVFFAAIAIHRQIEPLTTQSLTQSAMKIFPEDELLGQCIANGHYGSACMHLGNIVQARRSLEKAVKLIKIIDYPLMDLLWSSYYAQSIAAHGELSLARRYYEEISRQSSRIGVHKSNVFSNAIIGLGNLYYEINDLVQAEANFREGMAIAENGEYLERLFIGCLGIARIMIALGDYAMVDEKIAYTKSVAVRNNQPEIVLAGLEAVRARSHLAQGNLDSAARWASSVEVPNSLANLNMVTEYQLRVLTMVWLAMDEPKQAVQLARDLYNLALDQKRQWDAIQIGLTLVLAYDQDGDHQRAQALLLDILETAMHEGYIRSFLDNGLRLQAIMHHLQHNPKLEVPPLVQAYISALMQAYEVESLRLEQLGIPFAGAGTQEILTPREMDVLQLLAEGLSYKEISQQLSITENTLKSHIKNIYTKLEVSNRTQAINQATELGIMES